jgi:hypothetical protein
MCYCGSRSCWSETSNLCCCCSNEADGVNEENKPLLTVELLREIWRPVTAWGAQPLLARLTRGSWSWNFCYSWWRISLLLRRRLRWYWTAWVRVLWDFNGRDRWGGSWALGLTRTRPLILKNRSQPFIKV